MIFQYSFCNYLELIAEQIKIPWYKSEDWLIILLQASQRHHLHDDTEHWLCYLHISIDEKSCPNKSIWRRASKSIGFKSICFERTTFAGVTSTSSTTASVNNWLVDFYYGFYVQFLFYFYELTFNFVCHQINRTIHIFEKHLLHEEWSNQVE